MTNEPIHSTGKIDAYASSVEVYVTGVLPVASVGAESVERRVTRFTVLRLTSAKYAGGSLGRLLGAAEKCQAECGDVYACIDEVKGHEANSTGRLPRQSDPQILGSAKERGSER